MQMKMVTDIQIDLYGEIKYYMASAKQGDRATRYIRVQLMNNGNEFQIPDDVYLIANIKKPDGKFCYNECEKQENRVMVQLTNQVLAAAGTVYCDIEMRSMDGDLILSSAAFSIEIERSMRNENAIESSNEMTFLDKKVQKYIDRLLATEQQVLETEAAFKIEEEARRNAEDGRLTEEEIRKNNEEERLINERERQRQEELRQQQEENRQEDTSFVLESVREATVEAEKATENCLAVTQRAESALENEEQLKKTLEDAVIIEQNVSQMKSDVESAREQVVKDKEEIEEKIENLSPADIGALDTAGGEMTGELVPSGGLAHAGKNSWVAYPTDGIYTSWRDSETGYLVINLPQSWTDTMMKFAVTIFNYVTDTSVEYHISGYTYLDGKSWYNCSATCIGRAGAKTSNLTVRFGHDGTRCVILIGEPDSVWEYPQVKIHDVMPGGRNGEYSKWCSGWGVYISATTRPTITRTVSNTHVGYGSIAANALKVDNLAPYHAQAANTIVTRDAQGYTYLNYINCNTGDNENNYVSQVITTNGSDNFYRKVSLHHLKTSMALNNVDNIADTNKNVATAREVTGMYTGNGGAQPPSYVTSGRVRFNMMDRFPGFSANGYMDTILMDTYGGGDVPWVTGIGVTKAGGNPRMFIAVGSKGNSAGWSYMVEAITSGNIGSQSVNYATYAANAYNNTFTFGNGTYFTSHSAAQSSLFVNGRQFAFQADSSLGQFIPGQDNVFYLGRNGYKWKTVYAYNVEANRFCGSENGTEMFQTYTNVMNFHTRYYNTADPSTSKPCVVLWFGRDGVWLRPSGNNLGTLGSATEKWKEIYCSNATIQTSDERKKLNMKPLDESRTKAFIMGLNPISYIMAEGDSGRTHYGMGSQAVEQLMHNIGMTSKDFAGFIKSPKTHDVEVKEEIEVEKDVQVIDEDGTVRIETQRVKEIQKRMVQEIIEGEYDYGLRYEEFISPLIKMVQMQQRQLEVQAEEIKELRLGMQALEARIRALEI